MKSFEDYLAEQNMIAAEMHRAAHRRITQRKRTREERSRHRRMVATITGAALATVVFIAACSCVRATVPEEESRPVPMEPMSSPSGYPIVPIPEKVLARMAEPTVTPMPMPTPEPAPIEEEPAHAYTEEELEMMALVIYQEAGGDACSDDTRLKVGTVVMNRVADERPWLPDTIEEVLLQKGQYGRLHWTGLVWPERAELPQEAHAVARAYECAERILSGERHLPADVIFQSENIMGEIVAEQDGFYFCREGETA